MRFQAAMILLPLAAFAQTPAPDVDQALRARVAAFFQAHVDAKYTRAFDIVAEDTKEYYFATEKVRFKSFKIDDIAYDDDFTHAVVNLTVVREMKMRFDFPVTDYTLKIKTTWKIEDGKWCFYDHTRLTWLTAMGPSDLDKLKPQTPTAGGTGATPPAPDLSQAGIAAQANQILRQSSIDRSELTLPLDKPSTERIVFHNGQGGTVKIALADGAKPAGLTAELDKTDVNNNENAVVTVHFQPPADLAPGAIPANFTLRLVMEPFSIPFPITIKFGVPVKAARQ